MVEKKHDHNTELLRKVIGIQELRIQAMMLAFSDLMKGKLMGVSASDAPDAETDVHWDHYLNLAEETANRQAEERKAEAAKAAEEAALAKETEEAYGKDAAFFGSDVKPD